MKRLLILAISLRLLVSAFYFHPDIKTYNYQASFLKKGVFNIYTYLVDNKKSLSLKDNFVYFPLTYFTLGGYQWLMHPVLGNEFDHWLADAGINSFVRDSLIFRYLVVLKLPYIAIDVAIAYLLKKFFDSGVDASDKEKAKKAFIFWLFNPFTIALFYIFSNVDIFPIFLTVLSFLAIKKNKLLSASILLGVAAGFKLYPILFIPFVFLKGQDWKEKFKILLAPFLILAIIVAPFLSTAFIQSALISGLTTRIFNPGFSIGFGEFNIVGLMGFAALFFYGLIVDKKINLFNYWIALFLIIFSFTHFNIQWLGWIAPFLVILAVERPKLAVTIFILGLLAFLIPPLYDDRSMSFGLLRAYSTLYDLLPTPSSVIQLVYDPNNLQSILHSIVAGGSLVIVYKLFKTQKA